MDPVSLVVAALIAGLTAGVTNMAQSAINDMYDAFKARLVKKIEGKPDAKEALVAVEKKPESEARQAVLKEELSGLEIEKEAELLNLAKGILENLDERGAKSGKYNISIQNAQGVVIGDNAKVEMGFGEKPQKKRK